MPMQRGGHQRLAGRAHITHDTDRGLNLEGFPKADPVQLPNPTTPTNAESTSHDQVVILIENEILGKPELWPDCCIYKVPDRFRKGNEQFYKPRVVSLGPYHHKDTSFADMSKFKPRYVEAFIKRNRLKLDQCLGVVRSWEAKARSYYAEPIPLSSDEFAHMIFVDGIFVVELLLRHYFPEYRDGCDRIYRKPRMIEDVYHDILLIENQIPFFVLKGLYDQFGTLSRGDMSFSMLTHDFLKNFVNTDKFPEAAAVSDSAQEVKHFVDFLRCYYLPSSPSQEQRITEIGLAAQTSSEISPSVTALDEAGVKFETIGTGSTNTSTTTSLLEIQFTNGRLRMPKFIIDDWSETLFRNVVVFEQCHDHEIKYVSQFMFFMVCMIRTSKDADLLMDSGAISSMLGSSQDVSNLFHHISKDVGFSKPYYYRRLRDDLNAYCKVSWHKWRAILKKDYFNTPWKLVSTIAAIILLILTLIQTVCSILQVI